MEHGLGRAGSLDNLARSHHVDHSAVIQNTEDNAAYAHSDKALGIAKHCSELVTIVANASRSRSEHRNDWHAANLEGSFDKSKGRRKPTKLWSTT
jgi:hypothetical protein